MFDELKRRSVFKVAAAYVIVAWLIAQVAELALSSFESPTWVIKSVIFLLLVGFVLAVIFAWVFELTPDGVRITPSEAEYGNRNRSGKRRLELLIIGLLVIVCGYLLFDEYFIDQPGRTKQSAVATEVDEISIAVLPFDDLSAEEQYEYLCHGLASELQKALSQLSRTRVLSSRSARALKASGLDLQSLSKQFSISKIIEGEVLIADGEVYITAKLIDAATDSLIWSESFEARLEDLQSLQEPMAERIVQALKLRLNEKERDYLVADRTPSFEAYDYYVHGKYTMNDTTLSSYNKAQELFELAIAQDDKFVSAYAWLSFLHSWRYLLYEDTEFEWERANLLSSTAVALEPDHLMANVARGYALMLSGDLGLADTYFRRAVNEHPNAYQAYLYYGHAMIKNGEFERVASLWEKALEIDPTGAQILVLLPQVYARLGRDEDRIASLDRAVTVLESELLLDPDDRNIRIRLATMQAALGDSESALKSADVLLDVSNGDASLLYNLACLYSLSGAVEKSLDVLEAAIEAGFSDAEWIIQDSDLDNIRQDERFAKLLRGLTTSN